MALRSTVLILAGLWAASVSPALAQTEVEADADAEAAAPAPDDEARLRAEAAWLRATIADPESSSSAVAEASARLQDVLQRLEALEAPPAAATEPAPPASTDATASVQGELTSPAETSPAPPAEQGSPPSESSAPAPVDDAWLSRGGTAPAAAAEPAVDSPAAETTSSSDPIARVFAELSVGLGLALLANLIAGGVTVETVSPESQGLVYGLSGPTGASLLIWLGIATTGAVMGGYGSFGLAFVGGAAPGLLGSLAFGSIVLLAGEPTGGDFEPALGDVVAYSVAIGLVQVGLGTLFYELTAEEDGGRAALWVTPELAYDGTHGSGGLRVGGVF